MQYYNPFGTYVIRELTDISWSNGPAKLIRQPICSAVLDYLGPFGHMNIQIHNLPIVKGFQHSNIVYLGSEILEPGRTEDAHVYLTILSVRHLVRNKMWQLLFFIIH